MERDAIVALMDKWATVANEQGWVNNWCRGAIHPREMVFFLACCEHLGIEEVIESGRQDGFSTAVLGEFGARTGVLVHSIDYEDAVERAVRCRERLASFPHLRLLKGDGIALIGKLLNNSTAQRIAVLCDGPKDYCGLALLLAAAGWPAVKLVSMHNVGRGEICEYFSSLAEHPCFYEKVDVPETPNWQRLSAAECVKGHELNVYPHTLTLSRLGVLNLTQVTRARALQARHREFGMFRPQCVRWAWKLRLYSAAPFIQSLPARFSRWCERLRRLG